MSEQSTARGELAIYLGDEPVGDLILLTDDVTEFRLHRGYRDIPRRPILGQVFEDDMTAVHRARMRLPPFFSNLLPEGRLRELVAARLDVAPEREFFLLACLGEDLPGNVRAVVQSPLSEDQATPNPSEPQADASPLKFSLAGVQPKLSMVREGRGMTLPVSGRGGDWIVKLPGNRFRGVPENEFATMSWAALVGLDVPPVELIPMTEVRGLPPGLVNEDGMALAVRRFDRPSEGSRVHIEDFAQVRNVYPDSRAKYGSTNYETIGKIILHIAGQASFEEFIRRLAFIVVSANADAHIKNWSLIYPDGVRPQLSPAYDLVSTIEFIDPDALALNLAKTKAWEKLSLDLFANFAKRVGADPGAVIELVRQAVRRALDEWDTVRHRYPVSRLLAERLQGHWGRVPLVREVIRGG